MVAFIKQCQYNSDMAPDRMQLQKVCKKGARIFQRIRPKMERLGNSSSTPKNRERDYHNDSRHVTGVLLWKKWWVTHLQVLQIWSSPAKRSKWVWKEANLIILLGRMRKLGQMKRVRKREKPMLWLSFLYAQVSHQPNNVITQPFSLPTAHLSTKAIPKSTTKSVYRTSNDEHHL